MFLIKNNLRYIKYNLLFILVIFLLLLSSNLYGGESRAVLTIGSQKAKVTVKVFSSMTCPHLQGKFSYKNFSKIKKRLY